MKILCSHTYRSKCIKKSIADYTKFYNVLFLSLSIYHLISMRNVNNIYSLKKLHKVPYNKPKEIACDIQKNQDSVNRY